jgi:hypothetical protein
MANNFLYCLDINTEVGVIEVEGGELVVVHCSSFIVHSDRLFLLLTPVRAGFVLNFSVEIDNLLSKPAPTSDSYSPCPIP